MSKLSTSKLENDPAAWRGQDMMGRDDWRVPINAMHREELDSAIEHAKGLEKNIVSLIKKYL